MLREELVFVGTCDIAGHVRGKGFPAAAIDARRRKGIGWTHSNLMQTAFGPILDTPFGTAGDLMIVPDPSAEVRVDFADGSAPEHFFLGDIRNTDGTPWECCPREFLRRAIAALDAASGLRLVAAFEQEFVYTGNQHRDGDAYSLNAFRRQGTFGESFIAALRAAGVAPDSFLAEYGTRQFEVTVAPTSALTAADHAVITREMARAAAHRHGFRASFSPMPEASGVGNGVHIHMSLQDASGAPVTYAATGPMGLSMAAQHFCAGVLHHLPAICAITAPSPVSYLRLTPNRWAPTLIDIVQQDRGAAHAGLSGVCRGRSRRYGAAVQLRVPRLRCGRQSVPCAGRGDLRRRRWAATPSSVCRRRRAEPMNCRTRSARRSMPWRPARRWRGGSVRCSSRPICATSGPRCTTWPNGR